MTPAQRLARLEQVTQSQRAGSQAKTERREIGEAIAGVYGIGYEPVFMTDAAFSHALVACVRIYGHD